MRKQTFSILAVVLSTACGPQLKEEAQLDALAQELNATPLDQAMATTHFRPLCDANGFPLVGNVVSKVDVTKVSQFCAEVRRKHK